ncbi:MAG: helix-hairpin-helix domain-containing protein [Bacteroidaceae bacterium]|nr:helix-hairpin-helix domain-containing protein [Bacteroidaceae bacterium]
MKNKSQKNFFYFPKSDRRAVVALGCIAVFCIGVLMVMDVLRGQMSGSSDTVGENGLDEINATVDQIFSPSDFEPHVFDPNTVDSLTLVHFGIKPWKVKNFLHYRAAGKQFRKAEDMGDTYGWTKEDVEILIPYVLVDGAYSRNENKGKGRDEETRWERKEKQPFPISNKFRVLTTVDVNEADSALLCRIPGIGGGISRSILRYRTRLGGFYAVSQLSEIDLLSPELLEWFTVSPSPQLKKISLNTASFQVLNSHPYITYEQTKALLQYRRLYGNVENEEKLRSTGIFSAEDLDRLRPYLEY